ncbi:CU044_5270 family protein [Kribbella sp. NPDC051936]|uniref:CU044_5270 family protein n=1 Tax=Kribbella sp. NPDC051936 TaxID=3154946 RepID=UPI00343D297C
MNSTNKIDLLRRADPASNVTDRQLDERARQDLEQILRNAPAEALPSRQRVGRRTLLVGVAAATAGAMALVVTDPFSATQPAVAATPPMLDRVLGPGQPATAMLKRLAIRAVSSADSSGDGSGPHIVRSESWELSTRIDGKQVRSAVVPELTELNWNADRSGHLTVRTGQPYFPNADYRSAWKSEGSPGKQGTIVSEEIWPAGGYTPMFPNLPLPTDERRLLSILKTGHPIDQLGAGELVVAINDVYNESQPGAAVRASLLRLLAASSEVIYLGRATDRAGRPAECFAVDSTHTGLPQRQVAMFSPTTGSLLASEQILTKDAGQLGITTPSVIGYRLNLAVS